MAKNVEKFMNMIPLLEDIEFAGLCKILTVNPLDENDEVREFSDIVEELLKKFNDMHRGNRRELLRIMNKATKDRTLSEMTKMRKNLGKDVEDAAECLEVNNENI